MMRNFRTYELAKNFYHECQKIKLRGEMRDQFERATLSIVLNISEGSGKLTRKDRSRFYSIAYGSLRESMAILDLMNREELYKKGSILGAHLYKLIKNPGGL